MHNYSDAPSVSCSTGIERGWLAAFRPKAPVQRERRRQPMRKTPEREAVKRLSTSAVDVPKRESPESPPNEAPKPRLFASWMRTTKASTIQRRRKRKSKI